MDLHKPGDPLIAQKHGVSQIRSEPQYLERQIVLTLQLIGIKSSF